MSFEAYRLHHQSLLKEAAALAAPVGGDWSAPILERASKLAGIARPTPGLTAASTLAILASGVAALLESSDVDVVGPGSDPASPSLARPSKLGLSSNVPVFFSSTFSDTQRERAALHKLVFPAARKICAALGLSFLPVDLRWGVREVSINEHSVTQICLDEIEKAWQCSGGGRRMWFVGLLGDKVSR